MKEYLELQGFKDIVFEPDGNVTPDFLISGRIAVEARRLNQHHETETGEHEPLEALSKPLQKRLKKLLESFGPPAHGVSWFVSYTFKRPQLTKNWEAVLREKLRAFLSTAPPEREAVITIDRNNCPGFRFGRRPGGRVPDSQGSRRVAPWSKGRKFG